MIDSLEQMPYHNMAKYYDLVYHQIIDYEADCDFLERVFKKHTHAPIKSVLDVACGTGNHAVILARRGYKVLGIDRSPEMISVAIGKRSHRNPEFRTMDMQKLRLDSNFDVAIAMFGGFGYLLRDSQVADFLKSVRVLIPDGFLVFEFWHDSAILPQATTPSGFKSWVRVQDQKNGLMLIRLDTSRFDAQTNLLKITFDFYVFDIRKGKMVNTFSETHVTRTYSIPEMRHLLKENGFRPLAFYSGDLNKKRMKSAVFSTFRIMCVASRPNA